MSGKERNVFIHWKQQSQNGPGKVKAYGWNSPTAKGTTTFLGFANFIQEFIKECARPLCLDALTGRRNGNGRKQDRGYEFNREVVAKNQYYGQ